MKLELRNIKRYRALSEDSEAFSGKLYANGKLIAEVKDDGHGGGLDFTPVDRAGYDAAKAYAKALPAITAYGTTIPNDLELVCLDLLQAEEIAKDLSRALKRYVLILDASGVRQFGFKGVKVVEGRHIEHVRAQHPEAKCLNLMAWDDALAAYTQAQRA